jgi:nitrogenase iron protein NifH
LAGIICNHRGEEAYENRLLEHFASRLGCTLVCSIPRSQDIQMCEVHGKTVMEALPDSFAAGNFRRLADAVLDNEIRVIPTPMEWSDLEVLYQSVYAHTDGLPG